MSLRRKLFGYSEKEVQKFLITIQDLKEKVFKATDNLSKQKEYYEKQLLLLTKQTAQYKKQLAETQNQAQQFVAESNKKILATLKEKQILDQQVKELHTQNDHLKSTLTLPEELDTLRKKLTDFKELFLRNYVNKTLINSSEAEIILHDIGAVEQQLATAEGQQKQNQKMQARLAFLEKEYIAKTELETKYQTLQEQQNRLNKSHKNLQEDYEDLEEERDELADKCTQIKKQMGKLEEDFDQQNHQFNKTKQQLEEVEKHLDNKQKSLFFVQEILDAKPKENEFQKQLHAAVVDITNYIRDELKSNAKEWCNEQGYKDLKNLLETELDRWQIRRKKTWLNDKITIALIGEFSAGKTSIINALLRQKDPNAFQLPIDVKATTAIPTYISQGKGKIANFSFVTPHNEIKTIKEQKTIDMLSKEMLEQIKGVPSLIKYLVIEYPNPNLKEISILDTPGFSSRDYEDRQRTMNVINECDALFWVLDVNKGFENTSKTTIETINKHLQKPLYIIINKVDTKPDAEVDKAEKYIQEQLKNFQIKTAGILRFSVIKPNTLSNLLLEIKHINTTAQNKDELIDYLLGFINALITNYKKQIKELNQRISQLCRDQEECEQNIKESLINIKREISDSEKTIKESFQEHWFSDDSYDLSQSDLDQILEGNEEIRLDCQVLAKLPVRLTEIVADIQTRNDQLQEVKGYLSSLQHSQKILKYKISTLPDRK